MWLPHFYEDSTSIMFYPKFKFHGDLLVPIGCCYKGLDTYINKFKPHWRYGVAPAKRLWPDVTAMGVAIAKALQRYLPAVPRGSENWTHRLLRRTYASILHALHAPETLIQRQLLHECADAIGNCVVLYSDEDRALADAAGTVHKIKTALSLLTACDCVL